jgi:hypothetical protein
MHSPRRYLGTLLLCIIAGLAAVGGANAVIDPYGIWGLSALPTLRGHRPEEVFHDRMFKAHELQREHPDAVLLGTSRTQVGLDPHSPAFQGRAERVVNAALSDGQPWEAWRYLQHAEGLGPVKLAVMGLDYLSFDVSAPPNVEFSDARLSVDAEGQPQRLSWLADVAPALFSETALRASAHTLRERGDPSYFFEGGQRNPVFMQARQDEQGGMRQAMLFSERDYFSNFACYQPTDGAGYSRTLADLAQVVAECKTRGIALRLFFSPSHARSQLVIRDSGLWPAQEEWKRAVVELVETVGAGADIQVWDFAGAGRYTGEEVPPLDDHQSRMHWYWESSHYKGELGDLALARMLGQPDTAATADFGERVTTGLASEVIPEARAARRCSSSGATRPIVWAPLRQSTGPVASEGW